MKKLNLTEFLKSLGSPTLMEIYGKDTLQAMIDCLDISVSEKTITDLLKSRYGAQILSNKTLRGYIFANLDGAYIDFLKEGKFNEKATATIDDRERLIKTSWNRNTKSIQRLIEIFDLEDDYLPQKVEQKDSTFEIEPSFTLFPHQKRIKDKFVNFLKEGKRRMIINMPTGAGKTRTSVEGLVDYWRSFAEKESYIVWLAHSEELCEQAVETIKNTWEIRGEKNLRLFRLWGDHNPELIPN